jgi:hypothetical protein
MFSEVSSTMGLDFPLKMTMILYSIKLAEPFKHKLYPISRLSKAFNRAHG